MGLKPIPHPYTALVNAVGEEILRSLPASTPHLCQLIVDAVRLGNLVCLGFTERARSLPSRELFVNGWTTFLRFTLPHVSGALCSPGAYRRLTKAGTAKVYRRFMDCGRWCLLQYWEDLRRQGLLSVSEARDGFEVTPSVHYVSVELIDKDWGERLRTYQRKKAYRLSPALSEYQGDKILKELGQNTSLTSDGVLQYEVSPVVGRYLTAKSDIDFQTLLQYDAFPPSASFGHVSFARYRQAAHVIFTRAVHRHAAATALQTQNRRIDLSNALTPITTIQQEAEWLAQRLQTDTVTARLLLKMLTLTSDDEKILLTTGFPQPLYIELTGGKLINCTAGQILSPLDYLVRKLANTYPVDTSRAQNGREALFRDQLYRLFPGRLMKSARGKRLGPKEQAITDVDAIMYDPDTDTLALFQLKWNDPFGNAPNMRQNRADKSQEAARWVESIFTWIKEFGYQAFFEGIGKKRTTPPRETLVFVIGRYAIHFSGDAPPDPRAAWGTWSQIRALTSNRPLPDENPLGAASKLLVNNSPFKIQIGWECQINVLGRKITATK